jgi:DNA-binding CsgD family transcriptional regulator
LEGLIDLLQQPTQQVLARIHLPLVVIDASDRLVYVNPAASLAVGIPAECLVGIIVEEVIVPEHRARYLEHLVALRSDGMSLLRTWIQLPERDALPLAAIAVGLRGSHGGWLCQFCALLPDDVAEVDMAARLVRAGALARSLLRSVVAELDAQAGETAADSLSRLDARTPELEALTPQERAVALRLLRGDRTPTIARELRISPNTVRNHLKAIFRKTNTATQAELVAHLMSWPAGRNRPD